MKTKIILQREAHERRVDRAARTTKQQLALLDTRPGEQKRERARLAAPKAK